MAVVTVVAALAPVLKITAWAEADTKVISWPPDSEAIASIALCTNAGKEVVLLPESIECADYRSGYRLHRTKFPDMPMKIDWAPVCSYAKDQPQDFRRLSGDTIKRIVNLTKSSRDPHGIRIIGAVFCDTLDLAGLDLDHTLVIDRSLFYRGLDIRNFRTRGDLSFDGSLALDETSIRRSSIGGSVYAADAYIQRLQILDSEIKGSLLFRNSTIFDYLLVDTVSLSSEFSARNSNFSYFSLQRSKVGGTVDLTDSQARCAYVINKSEIGDLVAVRAGFGTSTRNQATDLDLFDWHFSRPASSVSTNPQLKSEASPCRYRIAHPGSFLIDDTRVHGSLCFGSFRWLYQMQIKGGQLRGSVTFNDVNVKAVSFIDLTPASMASPLSSAPLGLEDGNNTHKFTANGLKTDSLIFSSPVWYGSDHMASGILCGHDPFIYRPLQDHELRPETITRSDLTKFVLAQPPSMTDKHSLPTVDIDRLDFNDWPNPLSTSKYILENNLSFSPLLYDKMVSGYKKSGLYREATAIQYMKRNADYAHSDGIVRAAQFLSWATVGYGLYPSTGFLWFGILILIGYYVFRTGEKAVIGSYRPRSWLFYSLDTIIPVINLDQEHEKIRFEGWRQYYFYVMKIMSAVLVFLVLKVLQDTIVGP